MRGSTAFFLHLHYLESTFSIDCVAALLLTSLQPVCPSPEPSSIRIASWSGIEIRSALSAFWKTLHVHLHSIQPNPFQLCFSHPDLISSTHPVFLHFIISHSATLTRSTYILADRRSSFLLDTQQGMFAYYADISAFCAFTSTSPNPLPHLLLTLWPNFKHTFIIAHSNTLTQSTYVLADQRSSFLLDTQPGMLTQYPNFRSLYVSVTDLQPRIWPGQTHLAHFQDASKSQFMAHRS